MNNNPIFDSVRELISQGDADKALQVLITFLEKDGSQPDTLRTLRLVEANYRTARKQEARGILDFSEAKREYARTNEALITVVDDLVAGRKPTPVYSGTGDGSKRNPLLPWLIGGGIMIVVGALAGLWFSRPQQAPTEAANAASLECPKFRPDGYKVLVFEFQKLSGEDSKPELGIQARIQNLTKRNNVITDVKILSAKSFDGNNTGLEEAKALGDQCNVDMVIWGQYEKAADSIEVDISYALVNPVWPPGKAMETFKNISEIKVDQMKISNLDEAVFRLCTVMALHTDRLDLAKKWLNKLQKPNAREVEWKKLLEEN